MPDSTGSDDRLKFAYNRQGEIVSLTDQNGSVHQYLYDGLGRQIADRVSTVGSGVDDAVLRISTSYEVRGVPLNITSHDEASAGSVVNDVQREYNDFAQLVTEYQSHSGAVNTMTTPKCQYQYEDGSGNTIRPTALVYPNGRVLSYVYEDALSRITSIVDQDDQHLVDYSYLGLSSIIETESPEPGLVSTLIGIEGGNDPDTGDVYRGLDRFARVKDLIWTSAGSGSSSSSSGPADVVDRIQHGYDRASNRIWRAQLADPERKHDEFYTYDRLHRLKRMDRGTLNVGKTAIENPTFGQCWSLDATGNWRGFKEDKQGDGKWDLVQSRNANKVNEITSIKTHTSGLPMALPAPLGGRVGRGLWVQPRYDKNGNMVRMPRPGQPTQGFDAVYDAWNRLVDLGVGQYQYDGLRRRIVKVAGGETRHFYYSEGWQDLEERVDASSSADRQFVWGAQYIDDLVLRDRGAERLYSMHDPNWNVTAICDEAGVVQERYGYDAYGVETDLNASFDLLASSTINWTHLYTGQQLDRESRLHNFKNRYYHAGQGTFVSRDIITSHVDRNEYAICRGTPTNTTDPLGLLPGLTAYDHALGMHASLSRILLDIGYATGIYKRPEPSGVQVDPDAPDDFDDWFYGPKGFTAYDSKRGYLNPAYAPDFVVANKPYLANDCSQLWCDPCHKPGHVATPKTGPTPDFAAGANKPRGRFQYGFWDLVIGRDALSDQSQRSNTIALPMPNTGAPSMNPGVGLGVGMLAWLASPWGQIYLESLAAGFGSALGISRASCVKICVREFVKCIMKLPGLRCDGCKDRCVANCNEPKTRSINPWPDVDWTGGSCRF